MARCPRSAWDRAERRRWQGSRPRPRRRHSASARSAPRRRRCTASAHRPEQQAEDHRQHEMPVLVARQHAGRQHKQALHVKGRSSRGQDQAQASAPWRRRRAGPPISSRAGGPRPLGRTRRWHTSRTRPGTPAELDQEHQRRQGEIHQAGGCCGNRAAKMLPYQMAVLGLLIWWQGPSRTTCARCLNARPRRQAARKVARAAPDLVRHVSRYAPPASFRPRYSHPTVCSTE